MSVTAPPAAAAAAAQTPPKKKFNPLYVVVPLVIAVVIGVGVAWELFRARMEALQQGQGGEQRLGVVDGPMGTIRERKSRELKPKEEAPVVVAPVSDEDELTGLGKRKKPPALKVYPPAEKAWRAVKADYDKLEGRNETTARKYRIKILSLDGSRATASEAAFIKEAAVLEEALKEELSKPENQ